MTQTHRPKPTFMTVCDLCDEEIPEGRPDEGGSLTDGWIARKVEMPRTKRVWLLWPPDLRKRRQSWEEQQKPENRQRRYDFHADCILHLVEDAVQQRLGTKGTT
ncbi:hypothetical protein [Glycomyces sp. NPDC048151]|uniref:hypothetical protein n=1 Tax=Glycomyces sp. NPDC048151 TaxID=3364002 RepID=UPI00371DB8A3